MVELPVFVAEQFSWYLCFGMIIHQIPRYFTKNIKERLFYNVPENFASIDEIFNLRVRVREAKIGKINVGRSECKIFTPPQNTALKNKHEIGFDMCICTSSIQI
jgi:hypothetical protein